MSDSTLLQCIRQTTHFGYIRANGQYAKYTLKNGDILATVFCLTKGNEGQRGASFVPLAFTLQGEALMVKQTGNLSPTE